MKSISLAAAAIAATMMFAGSALAGSVTVTVPGTSNPFLVGYAAGGSVTINGAIDYTLAESPAYALAVSGGEKLVFGNTSGHVSNDPCCVGDGANGNSSQTSTSGGTTVGGYTNFPLNGLVGVFYDPSAAQGLVNGSLTSVTPGVNQVFYIGDGSLGRYVVPNGATSLFLATVDGWQWNNNTGAFKVNISTVPESATWAMMVAGFAGLGLFGWRRNKGSRAIA